MAQRIKILDDQVVNQIAAGEVVERPASVVKELVENAVDAGARNICVAVINGGRSEIEVLDDGCGMDRENALLAVERFGTSKIRDAADLRAVSTHGFRGEALPAIASVSRFSLTTCEHEENAQGVHLEIEGGTLRDVVLRAHPAGTRLVVRDLFFNVPARRKFLRSEATENGVIKSLLADFAAAYPELRFSLTADGVQCLVYPPALTFRDRVAQLRCGGDNPVIFEEQREYGRTPAAVYGALSRPLQAVADASRLRLLVNRRSVRDKLLLRAVRDAYGNYLKAGRYPQGIVRLDIPPDEVDVNVHPQKSEVRFRDPGAVFGMVRGCAAAALGRVSPHALPEEQRPPGAVEYALHPVFFSPEENKTGSGPLDQARLSFYGLPDAGKFPAPEARLSEMRFAGQVFDLYLILEGGGRLAIVDMHAAHERVMFYRLKNQFIEGRITAQQLLPPETIQVPPDAAAAVEALQPALSRLGVECEQFGETAVIVRALPALLGTCSAGALFSDLFSLAEESGWPQFIEQQLDAALARLACHSAVRSGDRLTAEEVRELLAALERADAAAFCPHGRPVAVFITRTELAGMFGRI